VFQRNYPWCTVTGLGERPSQEYCVRRFLRRSSSKLYADKRGLFEDKDLWLVPSVGLVCPMRSIRAMANREVKQLIIVIEYMQQRTLYLECMMDNTFDQEYS
jgi:hypothetical protein